MRKPNIQCYANYSNRNYGMNALSMQDVQGNEFYFSYDTLIAFRKGFDPLVVSKNYWSKTTGKHLNAINRDKSKRVDANTFDKLYQEAFVAKTLKELDDEIGRLTIERAELAEAIRWPKTVTYCLHASKYDNWELADTLGLDHNDLQGRPGNEEGPAFKFSYVCYELALTLQVHKNGSSFITHVEGVPLTKKVKVS